MKIEAIDHVHFCVPDLERAMVVLKTLAGGEFGNIYGGEELNARGAWNSIGLDVIQPIRDTEPVFGGSAPLRKGIVGASFRVRDLDARVPEVEALGLRLIGRFGSEESGFGKFIEQAQFSPADTFGATVELCEYVLPGYVPGSPFGEVIDCIELYVEDLEKAAGLFASITGAVFSPTETIDRIKAGSAANALGLRIIQPLSPESPIARIIAEKGEGFGAISFRTANLEKSIAQARSIGLEVAEQGAAENGSRQAQFGAKDTFGIIMKLTE